MSIRVYKPEDIRDLPKPVTLWAVWEGIDGRHHEEALEYRDRQTIPYTELRGKEEVRLRQIVAEESYPLLSLDRSKEDTSQVLPGTLRLARIEDIVNLDRVIDAQDWVYTLAPNKPVMGTVRGLSAQTLNGICVEFCGNYTYLGKKVGYEA